jgi:hypothetical protein
MKYQQELQKKWLNEQMKEKRERRRQEKENENNYAQFVSRVTQIRGEMENQFLAKKKQNQIEVMDFNQRMAKKKQIQNDNEKRDHYLEEREYLKKQEQIRRDTQYIPPN